MVESSSIEFMNVSLNMFATAGLGITRAASVKTEKFIKRLACQAVSAKQDSVLKRRQIIFVSTFGRSFKCNTYGQYLPKNELIDRV